MHTQAQLDMLWLCRKQQGCSCMHSSGSVATALQLLLAVCIVVAPVGSKRLSVCWAEARRQASSVECE